jgi:hypothetical protein
MSQEYGFSPVCRRSWVYRDPVQRICRWQCDLTRSQQMDLPSGFRAERIADHKMFLYKAVDRLNKIVRLQREIWNSQMAYHPYGLAYECPDVSSA